MAFTNEDGRPLIVSKEEWIRFVRVKAANDARGGPGAAKGTPITGPDLQKVGKIADRMDTETRRKVLGMFRAFSKYAVLNMLVADGNPILKNNKQEVFDIVEAAAGNDFLLEQKAREIRP